VEVFHYLALGGGGIFEISVGVEGSWRGLFCQGGGVEDISLYFFCLALLGSLDSKKVITRLI